MSSKLARDRARALHPRHASHPLRRRRLERFAAARRSQDARLDGEQLDGRAAVPAAQPLRRGSAPGRPARRRRRIERTRGRDAPDFNRISCATARSRATVFSSRAPAPPELLLHPSDTRTGLKYSLLPMTQGIIGGLFTPEQGAASSPAHSRAFALPRWRPADRPAGHLSRRPANHVPASGISVLLRPRDRPHVRSRPSALCARPWRFLAMPRRSGTRFSSPTPLP